MSGRARYLVLALALVLATAAACGVPGDDSPRRVADDALPVELRDPSSGTSTTLAGDAKTQVAYLVRTRSESEGRGVELVPRPINVTGSAEGDQLVRSVVETLFALKPEDAGQAELVNNIPPDTRVLDASIGNGQVLNLDLSSELSQGVQSDALLLAIAQIVFTATNIDGANVEAVRFSVDGSPVPVPIEAGTADAGRAVSRADFPVLSAKLFAVGDLNTATG